MFVLPVMLVVLADILRRTDRVHDDVSACLNTWFKSEVVTQLCRRANIIPAGVTSLLRSRMVGRCLSTQMHIPVRKELVP